MRLPDWPERLQVLIEGRREAPFSWGRHDCCSFAIAALNAVTGRVFVVEAYENEREALRVLACLGGFEHAVLSAGGREVPIATAQRGDLVLVDQPGLFGKALGVCVGADAMAAADRGLVAVPQDRWLKAWRI